MVLLKAFPLFQDYFETALFAKTGKELIILCAYKFCEIFINLQSKLDTLADSPRKKQLTAAIILLNEQLDNLKNLSADLQALHIKTVVNQMSVIYLAVSLLIEALHQQLHTKKEYKLYYYDYFCLLHLQNETLQYDKEYLHLITKIVNED